MVMPKLLIAHERRDFNSSRLSSFKTAPFNRGSALGTARALNDNRSSSLHAGSHLGAWRAPAQPKEPQCRDPPEYLYGNYWIERIGQELTRFRHNLRGGAAKICRNALAVRPTVFGPDGKAGGGFD